MSAEDARNKRIRYWQLMWLQGVDQLPSTRQIRKYPAKRVSDSALYQAQDLPCQGDQERLPEVIGWTVQTPCGPKQRLLQASTSRWVQLTNESLV